MGILVQILVIVGIIIFVSVRHLLRTDNKPGQVPANLPPDLTDFPPILPPLPPMPVEPARSKIRQQPASPPPVENKKKVLSVEEEQHPEFDISSIDEVRRAIIWSEILNRKY